MATATLRTSNGEVYCAHRDVSCCPACFATTPGLINVYEVVYRFDVNEWDPEDLDGTDPNVVLSPGTAPRVQQGQRGGVHPMSARTYLTGCPVWVTVADDGTVTCSVDTSELAEAPVEYDDNPLTNPDGSDIVIDEETRMRDREVLLATSNDQIGWE